MTATGGSIESVSYAGREFAVAADAEANIKLGGWENEVQANGNGTARIVKTRVAHAITGLSIDIDQENGDLEFLQARSNAKVFEPLAVTFASGVVYQGVSIVTGELQGSSQSATASVNFEGPGALTKQ